MLVLVIMKTLAASFGFLFCLCSVLMAQQKAVDSLSILLQQRQAANRTQDTSYANLLLDCALAYGSSSPENALPLALKALKIAEKQGFKKGTGRAMQIIGHNFFIQGDNQKALSYLERAVKTSEAAKDLAGVALASRRFGMVNGYMGKHVLAVDWFLKALRIEKQRNDPVGISTCLNNLGSTYQTNKDYLKSNEYLLEGLKVARENGLPKEEGLILGNLGSNALELGRYGEALAYFQDAIRIDKATENSQRFLSYDYYGLGNVYQRINRLEEAREQYDKSIQLSIESANFTTLALSYLHLAEIALKMGQIDKAITLGEQSFQVAFEHERHREVHNIADFLHKVYKQKGDFQKALRYYEQHTSLKDTIFNQDNERKIVELEAKFQFEQREKALKIEQERKDLLNDRRLYHQRLWMYGLGLAFLLSGLTLYFTQRSRLAKQKALLLLQEKNQEIVRQQAELKDKNEKLEELNQLKTKIFSIISHDLRSPLGLLQDILNLVDEGGFTEAEFKALIPHLTKNVSSTNSLVENLLSWAHSQLEGVGIQQEFFDLQALTEERMGLFDNLAIEKGIRLVNELPENFRVYADQNMLGLVLKNLLDNAVKFCQAGDQISVSGEIQAGQALVKVQDSGVGITAERLPHIFDKINSTRGTRNEKGTGLGLILCKDFVEKNQGKIWVESQPNHGTAFYFTLPTSFESANRVPLLKEEVARV
jgi:two-component system, sensor histidine kinase and response regulator